MGNAASNPNYVRKHIVPLFSVSKIVTIHYFEFNASFCSEREYHDFWEFVYVDKGVLMTEVSNREYVLSQGEYIFHKPNDRHRMQSYNGTSPNVFIISFVCRSPAMNIFPKQGDMLPVSLRKYIADIIGEARRSYHLPFNDSNMLELMPNEDELPGEQQLIQIRLEQFLIYLYRYIKASDEIASTTALVSDIVTENEIVNQLIQYIQKTYMRASLHPAFIDRRTTPTHTSRLCFTEHAA